MNNILVTSDLHLYHDREFVYKPRGFNSIDEMNEAILENWNKTVDNSDIVYILGDIMLNDNDKGMELFNKLNGIFYIIRGNHDTDTRVNLYESCEKVRSVKYADMIKYKGYHFFMTHYPCMTGNLEKESLKQCTLNLFGHTHQKTNFYQDMPFMYHVGMDSHNCTPVLIDDIIEEMNEKVEECKRML